MDNSLKGKVVIVSGASKRLGRCYALSLGRAGATVVALARTLGDSAEQMGSLREVEATGARSGYDIHAMRCDLGDESDIRRVVAETVERFGGVDAIVNNAVHGDDRKDPLTIPSDAWEASMRINVRAPCVLASLCHPHMVARGGGSIINITSLAAGPTGKGGGAHRGLLLYGASKTALNRLTTWCAAEFAEDNIAVNALSPGDVSSYLLSVNSMDPEQNSISLVEGQQLDEKFWGDPVVWLAGIGAKDLTGETVHTYTFGDSWGIREGGSPEWSSEVLKILGWDNLSLG